MVDDLISGLVGFGVYALERGDAGRELRLPGRSRISKMRADVTGGVETEPPDRT